MDVFHNKWWGNFVILGHWVVSYVAEHYSLFADQMALCSSEINA
jgi:hypothetical protein